MDSGISILNLSTNRKVLAFLCLVLPFTFREAWRLEISDCKTQEILRFPPFL